MDWINGQTIEEIVRQLDINDAAYYKWNKEYGGLQENYVMI